MGGRECTCILSLFSVHPTRFSEQAYANLHENIFISDVRVTPVNTLNRFFYSHCRWKKLNNATVATGKTDIVERRENSNMFFDRALCFVSLVVFAVAHLALKELCF